jgi:hypothetical protein
MEQEKNFWQKFNPSLKEMMEKHPSYSVLGLWWSFTWRIWILGFAVWIAFVMLVIIFGLALHR